MRLNPSSSVDDPNNLGKRIEVCNFCRHPLTEKLTEFDGRLYPFGDYEPCECAENIENTAKWKEAFQIKAEPLFAEAKRKRVALRYKECNLPARWEKRTFEVFNVNASNEVAYDAALEYVKQFDRDNGTGLLLGGTVGTGKTHLAAAITMALMDEEYKVVFGTVNSLLSKIRYSYSDDQADTEAELFERYTTCDLLVIDDLGKERVSDWTEQIVFDIINTRYENNKALVITTNLGLKEIKAKYRENGEALIDRLLEMCKGIKLEGDSWRRKAIG